MKPEVAGRSRPTEAERDVRQSWNGHPPDHSYRIDWIGIHPSRDYDLMFFDKDKRGPVVFVFCESHCRVHGTGWCTVDVRDKRPLKASTIEDAEKEAVE